MSVGCRLAGSLIVSVSLAKADAGFFFLFFIREVSNESLCM